MESFETGELVNGGKIGFRWQSEVKRTVFQLEKFPPHEIVTLSIRLISDTLKRRISLKIDRISDESTSRIIQNLTTESVVC